MSSRERENVTCLSFVGNLPSRVSSIIPSAQSKHSYSKPPPPYPSSLQHSPASHILTRVGPALSNLRIAVRSETGFKHTTGYHKACTTTKLSGDDSRSRCTCSIDYSAGCDKNADSEEGEAVDGTFDENWFVEIVEKRAIGSQIFDSVFGGSRAIERKYVECEL